MQKYPSLFQNSQVILSHPHGQAGNCSYRCLPTDALAPLEGSHCQPHLADAKLNQPSHLIKWERSHPQSNHEQTLPQIQGAGARRNRQASPTTVNGRHSVPSARHHLHLCSHGLFFTM